MKRKLVFWTAFNSYRSPKLLKNLPPGSAHPVTTPEWTKRRAELFKKYTLRSILNQEFSDFYFILLLDPELKYLTKTFLPGKIDKRIIYCYWDKPVLNLLRKYDEIVLALIDNDDMYGKNAGAIMMESSSEWMYFRNGYAYNDLDNKLYLYDTIGSGPFFARRIDPKKMVRFDRDKRHPTHKAVINLNPEVLSGGQFCVLIHDRNTSSRINMRYIGNSVDAGILKKEFGQ